MFVKSCIYCDAEFKAKNNRKIFCSDTCRKLEHKFKNNENANPFGNAHQLDDYYQIINERIQFDRGHSEGNYIVDECLKYLKTGHYKKMNIHLDYLTRKLTNNKTRGGKEVKYH